MGDDYYYIIEMVIRSATIKLVVFIIITNVNAIAMVAQVIVTKDLLYCCCLFITYFEHYYNLNTNFNYAFVNYFIINATIY